MTWWIGIIVSLIISFIIIQIAIRIPPDKRKTLMISIGMTLILIELVQQAYLKHFGIWNAKSSLPIHLCGISGILAGIMMIRQNYSGFEFLALIGSPGALHAILTPQLNHGPIPFLIFKYYVSHAGIILVPLFFAIVLGYRIKESSWYKVFLLCQLLILFVGLANFMIGSNYMYLTKKPLVNNPMIIGEWPWYIIGFEILGLIHILLFYYGYRQMRPLPY
ncbi:MAG: TIGR02206 family membrane protein [Candidatus Marinimicrobia bacterium]|nr:TIGR02206 family membrane protein [Candidatus Neomarinimicrobiota bacterium]